MGKITTIINQTKKTFENTIQSAYTNLSAPQKVLLDKILSYNS